MTNTLYPFFWQHGESHEVLGEYMEKIVGCGMKAACIEARPHPDFVGEGWWKDLDFILSEAKKREMKLWILDDSHFPTGFANGKIRDEYPQYLKKYLDMRRYDVQGPFEGARINLKLLKGRPWEKPDTEAKILGVYMAKRVNQRTGNGDAVLADTMTDITARMRKEDQLLTVDIPDGAYSIFIVFVTKKCGEESTKDYLNPLVKEATQVLIDEVYEPHFAHYREEFGKTIEGFFSDEPRFGNIKGTEAAIGREDMVLPWRDRLETELGFEEKMLPLLWVKAEGKESEIRFRYMDTVTRLYNENFTKVLGEWCHAHGVYYLGHTIEDNGAHARLGYGTGHFFRGQEDMDFSGIDVIGTQIVPGMNYHHDAFSTGGSNGEFYHYALAKLGSSAAHLDPKKQGRCMCEAFGAYGWNEGLKMMKWITDHLMVRGVNYIVPHAFNPKEFPDFDCPPHFYAHGHNPQFRYFKKFTDYVNRTLSIMRGGMRPAKVGLLYPAEMEWGGEYMPVEKPARELTTHQISFDIVTRDYLKTAKVQEGIYAINGVEFEVLVVPYGEYLPEEMKKIIETLKAAGVQIVKVGFEDTDSVSLDELGNVLRKYKAIEMKDEQPDLVVGEYIKEGRKYLMMTNEHIGHSIDTAITFKESGTVYCYDAMEDVLTLSEKTESGYHLQLSPYESRIWVLSDEKLDAVSEKTLTGPFRNAEFGAEWKVQYADSFSYPNWQREVPMTSLGLISDLEGWEDISGTVRYSSTFTGETCSKAVVKLGEVYETAEVFVNGQSAGVRICKPYEFDVSGLIQSGENEIAIEVTNTLGTTVRDALSHYLMIEPFGIKDNLVLEMKG